MRKSMMAIGSAGLLAGCAATYAGPTIPNQSASVAISKSQAQILIAARKALVIAGYQITSFDDAAGVISTAPRNVRVTPEQADCGTTMGLDYLKDNRTDTMVAYGVIASDGHLQVRATIQAAYKPGQVDQNITLSCVSRGVLDNDMATQIQANM